MKNQKIIELYAGPGSGKSTLAARLFSDLKFAGYNVELVREVAKEEYWRHGCIKMNQATLLTTQALRQWDLVGKVDLIITDSPLQMSQVYGSEQEQIDFYNRPFCREPVFVRRVKPYNPAGREQSEAEAIQKDGEIWGMIGMGFKTVSGDLEGAADLFDLARNFIRE